MSMSPAASKEPMLVSLPWTLANHAQFPIESVERMVLATTTWGARERREQQRTPFPKLLTITPVSNISLEPSGESFTAVGKNLALRGLDFFHCEKLPHRRVIVSFDELPWEVHLLMSISWCRFLRPGWYDSGGRFTHVVTRTERPTDSEACGWGTQTQPEKA